MKLTNLNKLNEVVSKEVTGWVGIDLPYNLFETLFEGCDTKEARSARYKELTFDDYANEDGDVRIKFQEKGAGDTVAYGSMPLETVEEIFLVTNSRYLVNAKVERKLGATAATIIEIEPA